MHRLSFSRCPRYMPAPLGERGGTPPITGGGGTPWLAEPQEVVGINSDMANKTNKKKREERRDRFSQHRNALLEGDAVKSGCESGSEVEERGQTTGPRIISAETLTPTSTITLPRVSLVDIGRGRTEALMPASFAGACGGREKDAGKRTASVAMEGEVAMETEPGEGTSGGVRPPSPTGGLFSVDLPPSKRRGPPTTGEYTGLANAKQQLLDAEERELSLAMEHAFVEEETLRKELEDFSGKLAEADLDDGGKARRAVLLKKMEAGAETAMKVATTSGSLKGTYIKSLKGLAEDIKMAAKELGAMTASEELARVERDNRNLREEVSRLRAGIEEIKRSLLGCPVSPKLGSGTAVEGERDRPKEGKPSRGKESWATLARGEEQAPRPSPAGEMCPPGLDWTGELAAMIMRQVGDLVGARFGAIESRLLPPDPPFRPASLTAAAKTGEAPTTAPPQVAATKKKKKGKAEKAPPPPPLLTNVGGKKGGQRPLPLPVETAASARRPPAVDPAMERANLGGEGRDLLFTEVVRRGKKKIAAPPLAGKLAAASTAGGGKPRAKPAQGKASPSSRKGDRAASSNKAGKKKKGGNKTRAAAVVLTVPPEREETLTYAEVMRAARSKVDLKALDIDHLRVKKAMTGGLILEVPGQETAQRADKLAERLSVALAQQGVKISRPVTRAELRVAGLDDSVSAEEVAAAIAEAGDCSSAEVQMGAIRPAAGGLRGAWARAPRAAAIKAAKPGGLGWGG